MTIPIPFQAQFKTMKYQADYPATFPLISTPHLGSHLFDRLQLRLLPFGFQHLLTPAAVHYGWADQVQAQRQHVLQLAYTQHTGAFCAWLTHPRPLPTEVWINQPSSGSPISINAL
ncbi:MAG: hypothetical protein H6633_09280 [Anaerolineales bacterium]|nr:hypothetical protein [Anaerolineales bacterium]